MQPFWIFVTLSVMVRMLASNVVNHGFKPRTGQTKDYKIGICCFSAKNAAFRSKSRLVGSESGCVKSGAICLPANSCPIFLIGASINL